MVWSNYDCWDVGRSVVATLYHHICLFDVKPK